MSKVIFQDGIHRPTPIISFSEIRLEGKVWKPDFGDKHALIILKRTTPKRVSFLRAYTGWRMSGAKEESELGQGRAFLRWLQRHQLSIEWEARDFTLHPFFQHPDMPKHDESGELAKGMCFAVRPVTVGSRRVKLYLEDQDMLSVLSTPYGEEEDFLELVAKYVAQRFEWEKWRAPAPPFLDWAISHGKRAVFSPGQLGFHCPQVRYG